MWEIKSIRGLLKGSEERLGVRTFSPLPDREIPGGCCPECFLHSDLGVFPLAPPGSMLVLSAVAAQKLRIPEARQTFLARVRKRDLFCIAFADDQEPPEEVTQFCLDHNIALFVSSFGESYLQSRITGLIRERIQKTVVIHGVFVNICGLGLLITGDAAVGKTNCGLALAKNGHVWIADDLVEVKKRGGKLYGRGYGTARSVIAIRDEGIVACRSYPGISRVASDSVLQLWCELRPNPQIPGKTGMRAIMDVSLPFSIFPSFACHRDPAMLIEKWVQGCADPKGML